MSRLRTILSFVFAITILSQFSPLWAENAVPVVMWGDSASSIFETTAVNPFVKTTRDEFNKILSNVVKEHPSVLVFLSDNFCVEDIVRHRKHLQQAISGAKYNYINAVEEPIDAFKELPMYNKTDDIDGESISNGQLVIKPIVNLDILPEMISEIKNRDSRLLIVLTGKACAYRKSERVRRQATPDSKEFIFSEGRVLFYASEALHLIIDGKDTPLSETVMGSVREGTPDSTVIAHMKFNGEKYPIDLEFNFEVKTAGYFTLETINYLGDSESKKRNLKATSTIVFPFHFSYHCSQNTIFKYEIQKDKDDNKDIQLVIKNLQVEIDGKKDRFNDAYDCVGFTTIPIWTGLFVTAILAAIMIWGLSMIIDIRTMDRFDDPKGKTITISAQE